MPHMVTTMKKKRSQKQKKLTSKRDYVAPPVNVLSPYPLCMFGWLSSAMMVLGYDRQSEHYHIPHIITADYTNTVELFII